MIEIKSNENDEFYQTLSGVICKLGYQHIEFCEYFNKFIFTQTPIFSSLYADTNEENIFKIIMRFKENETEEEYYQRMEKLLSFATDLMIAGVSDIRKIFDMILDNIETQIQFVDMKFGENMNVIFMLIQSIMRNKFVDFTQMEKEEVNSLFGRVYLENANGFFDNINNDIDEYVEDLREVWNENDIMMNVIDDFHAFVSQWGY